MKNLFGALIFILSLSACGNDDDRHDCYDPSLVHENACTADCPGFQGCDGNTYCNACEAARQGIGPK